MAVFNLLKMQLKVVREDFRKVVQLQTCLRLHVGLQVQLYPPDKVGFVKRRKSLNMPAPMEQLSRLMTIKSLK